MWIIFILVLQEILWSHTLKFICNKYLIKARIVVSLLLYYNLQDTTHFPTYWRVYCFSHKRFTFVLKICHFCCKCVIFPINIRWFGKLCVKTELLKAACRASCAPLLPFFDTRPCAMFLFVGFWLANTSAFPRGRGQLDSKWLHLKHPEY